MSRDGEMLARESALWSVGVVRASRWSVAAARGWRRTANLIAGGAELRWWHRQRERQSHLQLRPRGDPMLTLLCQQLR